MEIWNMQNDHQSSSVFTSRSHIANGLFTCHMSCRPHHGWLPAFIQALCLLFLFSERWSTETKYDTVVLASEGYKVTKLSKMACMYQRCDISTTRRLRSSTQSRVRMYMFEFRKITLPHEAMHLAAASLDNPEKTMNPSSDTCARNHNSSMISDFYFWQGIILCCQFPSCCHFSTPQSSLNKPLSSAH